MDEKNRGYVSPEMDVILLEQEDVACSFNWCVSEPDGTSLGDQPVIECPPDNDCATDSNNW